MCDLLKTMAEDLHVFPYYGESESDYCYRVCYSALALSLLYSARSIDNGKIGISKKAQTDLIQQTLTEYEKNLNLDGKRFWHESNSFILQTRKVYEETGYLVADKRGYEVIASYGRTVPFECGHLYFGIPNEIAFSRGLGFFTSTPGNEASLFETFLRDTLTSDKYIAGLYNPLDFDYRDIDQSTLLFFNPFLKKPPSSSWGKEIRTRRTVAKDNTYHTMYRVICEDDGRLLFADLSNPLEKNRLTSGETRRLLFALKEQHGEPVVAWFNRIDEKNYEIKLSAHLPNREYYFLLLCAWPKKNAFDRISFVATADILPTIEKVLKNIGIKTIRGKQYV